MLICIVHLYDEKTVYAVLRLNTKKKHSVCNNAERIEIKTTIHCTVYTDAAHHNFSMIRDAKTKRLENKQTIQTKTVYQTKTKCLNGNRHEIEYFLQIKMYGEKRKINISHHCTNQRAQSPSLVYANISNRENGPRKRMDEQCQQFKIVLPMLNALIFNTQMQQEKYRCTIAKTSIWSNV